MAYMIQIDTDIFIVPVVQLIVLREKGGDIIIVVVAHPFYNT